MLQDLSGEEWADTATPPLDFPRKNLQLQLGVQPMEISMVFLSNDSEEKNTIEKKNDVLEYSGSRRMAKLLLEFNQNVKRNMDVEEFKEELWDIMVAFGEPIEIGRRDSRGKLLVPDG